MYDICSRSKGQRSRSQGHVPYAITRHYMVISTSNLVGIIYVGSTSVVYFLGQKVKQTESRNMADIEQIKCNGKRRQIAKLLHSNRKSGSANRTAVSKFTQEYGGHSAYKMQKSMEKRLQIAEISSAVSYKVIAS